MNLCIEKDKEFKKLEGDKISKLTIYATEIRYPEEYLEATIEEVRDFYEIAKEVKDFVIKRLKDTGLERSK